ncbi:MAG: alginate export family protein [Calditrichaceae bacterium]|nr:alginate export family protein [Calditrichaceae bacterium]MBN2707505.1 alginate export family protein [Calditrichaceae bacterium]RQV95596.1 MAG: hypothetical protein EH224_06965 [Calditrichota bacterium]
MKIVLLKCYLIEIVFIALNLLHPPLILYGQLIINSELRPRIEHRDGYGSLPVDKSDPACFVSQRSRLNILYSDSLYNFTFSVQDVRVWGDATIYKSTGVHGSEASLDLYQANFEWFFHSQASLKIGRQTFAIDDERLISPRNWNQNGLSYDALLLRYGYNKWNINLGLSLNNDKENKYGNLFTPDKMKTLNFIHFQRPLESSGRISFLSIASGFTKSDTSEVIYMKGTIGTFINFKLNNIEYSGSAYYQFGKNKSGVPVRAYFLNSNLTIKSNALSVMAGIDYLSGNPKQANPDKDRLFDLLYGTRHRYFGSMDYFSDPIKSTHSRGLADILIKGNKKIFKDFAVQADLHFFYLQDNKPVLSDYLGKELDLSFSYQCAPVMKLIGGISVFNSSKYFCAMQSGNVSDRVPVWAWLTIDFKLNLYNQEINSLIR